MSEVHIDEDYGVTLPLLGFLLFRVAHILKVVLVGVALLVVVPTLLLIHLGPVAGLPPALLYMWVLAHL
ncbi:hypothetical protein [Halopiger aswanensis]|uniref:hypothetical protein n=1 Tax=Halopiger aswanensis TaxID=148449 RepID=UPI000E744FF4|nr:hypothetical protein [Halopiger aswanensis]